MSSTNASPAATTSVIVSATPWSDVADRIAIDTGGIATIVRLCALPMNASPTPRRRADVRRGTSDIAAGRFPAIPMPWNRRATTNGSDGPPGSTPGRIRIAQPMR